jgi:uncharacterized protein YneF (UPF0154 family)
LADHEEIAMAQTPGGAARRSLQSKLTMMVGIAVVVLALNSIGGLWLSWRSVETYSRRIVPLQAQATQIVTVEADFKRQVQEWKDTLLRGKDPAAFDKHWGQFQERERGVAASVQALIAQTGDPETQSLLKQFAEAHKTMGDSYRKALDQFKASGFDSTVGDKAVAGVDRAPTTLLANARERMGAIAKSESESTDARSTMALWAALGIMLAISAGAIGGAMIAVRRMVTRPLTRAVGALGELAAGNTDCEIAGTARQDEIGEISRAMLRFRESMITADRLAAEQKAEQAHKEARSQKLAGLNATFSTNAGNSISILAAAATDCRTPPAIWHRCRRECRTRRTMR